MGTSSSPTDDESITRRRRASAPIQVLTDLERTKSSLVGDFWGDTAAGSDRSLVVSEVLASESMGRCCHGRKRDRYCRYWS